MKWKDSLTLRAEEHGCNSCGARGNAFYAVEFYILPTRLRRKRHRDRHQTALFCRDCYEQDQELPILIDGQTVFVSKTPSQRAEDVCCMTCGCALIDNHGRLYSMVTSSLIIDSSCIEWFVLLVMCHQCVETHRVGLVGKICNSRS